MSSFSINRLRHITRRLFSAPPSLVVARAMLEVRKLSRWPACALARLRPRATPPIPASSAFTRMGADLRSAVARSAESDGIYLDLMKTRARWVLDEKAVPCLGYGILPLPHGAAWRSDAVGGLIWPASYFAFVNYLTHGKPADVKVPWELSRLQWLVWLAEATVAHPDELQRRRASTAMATLLAEWRTENPFGYGPNWTVAMEVAIRAINLGLAVAIGWESLAEKTRNAAVAMLHEHLSFLRDFPEISDTRGNHYLVGICGRVFLERVVFGSPKDAKSDERLVREAAEQFENDGIHIEHAPMYHRLCTEAVLWTAAWAVRSGGVPSGLSSLSSRCCRALRALSTSTGDLPVIGDNDSGQIVSTGTVSRATDYVSQLTGLKRGACPLLAAAAGDGSIELMAQPLTAQTAAAAYERVGPFVRLVSKEFDVTVRAGAHGLHGRASHDHDDNAAPWVAVGPRDLLVEAGCYTYTGSLVDRAVDIATKSHNLVTIGDRLRFAPVAGSISPTVASAPVATIAHRPGAGQPTLDLSIIWRDEFAGAVKHAREIALNDPAATVEITDLVALERPAAVRVCWHFAPGWTVTLLSDGTARATAAETKFAVHASFLPEPGSTDLSIEIGTYRHSAHYGQKEDAPTVVISAPPATTVRVRSVFRLISL